MSALQIILGVASFVVGIVGGVYAPRLFPKYKRGTTVNVGWSYNIRCEYLYRSAIGFHKVRVLPGDMLGWQGRVITVRTSELWVIA